LDQQAGSTRPKDKGRKSVNSYARCLKVLDTRRRAEDAIPGNEILILEKQSLVDEARYLRQKTHPPVVTHGEGTSYVLRRRNGAMGILVIRGWD
jgi:hypothetical protein